MKPDWKNPKYKSVSIYVIITAAAIIAILLFLLNLSYFGNAIAALFGILTPFIVGAGIAYLLSRPAAFMERKVFAFVERKKPHPGLRRSLSILTVFLIMFGIIGALIYFIIPQIIESLSLLIVNIPTYIYDIEVNLYDWFISMNFNTQIVTDLFDTLHTSLLSLTDFFNEILLLLPDILSSVGTGLLNFFIGLVVCIHMLYTKEKFARQGKKIVYAICTQKFADRFMEILKYSNNVFLGFIMGTLTSAVFVGTSTFIFLLILQVPYAPLIGVIIGCTNIIPFFGPFLGAIPSVIILLMVDPLYALFFLIFILVLQQVDGNIILPRVVASNVGLSAFWVLFALILGGGLFGIMGLILGGPIFAIIYSIIKTIIDGSLQKKGIPTEIYTNPKDIVSQEDKPDKPKRRKAKRVAEEKID